jgi:hypothetical protein
MSYFYPPASFVGSSRPAAWVQTMHNYGYYPIIITRQWNIGQCDIVDKVKNNKHEIERFSTHEVHRLPFNYALRDRFAKYSFLKFFQKSLTLLEVFFSNFFISALPYSNFYSYSRRLLKENADIKAVIASGRPFQSFLIGHQLKKQFDVLWIPDYRDDWTTRPTNSPTGFINNLLFKLDKKSEKKWLSNADGFITVNNSCKNDIEEFHDKRILGKVIMNGYDEHTYDSDLNVAKKSTTQLEIIYLGTLYPYQDLTVILESINAVNAEEKNSILLSFLGADVIPDQKAKLEKLSANYSFLKLLPRVSKSEMIEIVKKYDLGLIVPYTGLKDCLPVKAFDYLGLSIPMLLCPSDSDAIESFIRDVNFGYIAKNESECVKLLNKLLNKKNQGISIVPAVDEKQKIKYSRKEQTKALALYLDELLISKQSTNDVAR